MLYKCKECNKEYESIHALHGHSKIHSVNYIPDNNVDKLHKSNKVKNQIKKEQYYKNPKKCPQCDSIILYNKRQNIFCNNSHKATYINLRRCKSIHKKQSNTLLKTIGVTDEERKTLKHFHQKTTFIIKPKILPYIKGYDLYLSLGEYDRNINKNGVVRDHMLSRKEGLKLNLSTEIIKHPANCEFMTYRDNIRKSSNSSITLEKLMERIEYFDNLIKQFYSINPSDYNTKNVMKMSKEEKQEQRIKSAQERYKDYIESGLSMAKFAKTLNISRIAVYQCFKKYNLI